MGGRCHTLTEATTRSVGRSTVSRNSRSAKTRASRGSARYACSPICARLTTIASARLTTRYLSQIGYGARRRFRRLRRGIAFQFGKSARSPLHTPSAGIGLGASDTCVRGSSTVAYGKKDAADASARRPARDVTNVTEELV